MFSWNATVKISKDPTNVRRTSKESDVFFGVSFELWHSHHLHHHKYATCSKEEKENTMPEEKKRNGEHERAVVQERKENQDSYAKEQAKKKKNDAEKEETTGCWACLKRVLIAPPIKDTCDDVWCEL